jgi:leader peptidase (prepilin peptidase) / N-methyltransferase
MLAPACLALLCLASVTLAWIDLRQGIIPDWLNLLILLTGLAWSYTGDGTRGVLVAAGAAAIVGATVWLLRRLYFALRQIQGLGLGDVKFLAAATAWVGIAGIPMLLLVAALAALMAAGVMQVAGQAMTRRTALPFGPFLTIGLWAALVLELGGYV